MEVTKEHLAAAYKAGACDVSQARNPNFGREDGSLSVVRREIPG